MIDLTSYERMRRYLSLEGDTLITDSVSLRRELTPVIRSVSRAIQQHLGYDIEQQSYTEYFDAKYNQREFWLNARPITALGVVEEDPSGLFTGDESELDDCFIGEGAASFCLPDALSYVAKRAVRVSYTAGMAISGVDSVFGVSATFNIGSFAASSDAMGIVKESSATSLTLENLYGIFEVGDTVTEYTDENMSITGVGSSEIASVTSQSLAESYPDIVHAAEMQVRFMYKHKHDFELTSTNRDATNLRRDYTNGSLTPETKMLLAPYVKHI